MLYKLRMSVFAVAYPARAAGCEQRQIFAGLQSLQQLVALLDDRQVCAVCRIEDLIEAHAMQHVDDLAHHVFALRQIKSIANGNSNPPGAI